MDSWGTRELPCEGSLSPLVCCRTFALSQLPHEFFAHTSSGRCSDPCFLASAQWRCQHHSVCLWRSNSFQRRERIRLGTDMHLHRLQSSLVEETLVGSSRRLRAKWA